MNEIDMSVAEIHALLALLDDPDDSVFLHVRGQLLSKGKDVLPYVEAEVSKAPSCELFLERLEELRVDLQRTDIRTAVSEWTGIGERGLWEGAMLVHRAFDPQWDFVSAQAEFDQLRREIWLELNDEHTALEQVRIINHILFSVKQLESVRKMPHSPADALPAAVLSQGRGNPLGLGILYLSIAEALGLPIRGVNLPNHFVLAYCDEAHVQSERSIIAQAGILFYINPFSDGTVIGPVEVSEFLSPLDEKETARQWKPSGSPEIIHRLVQHVAFSLKESGEEERGDALLGAFRPLISSSEDSAQGPNDHSSI
ncbi:MAG: transglutaminase family protein [Flavobacteriales bacterium]|nr:transglutaminase family protein [Flavobacteriales bacterium]